MQQGTDQIVVKRKGSIVAERKFSIYQYNSKVSHNFHPLIFLLSPLSVT